MSASVNTALLTDLTKTSARDGISKTVVGAVLTDDDRNVLLLHRPADDYLGGLWELPSGGVDEGETLLDALRREVKEETGLTVASVDAYLGHFDYLSKSGRKTRQYNFAVTTHGETAVTLTEHDAHEWAGPEGQTKVSSAVRKVLEDWGQSTLSHPKASAPTPSPAQGLRRGRPSSNSGS